MCIYIYSSDGTRPSPSPSGLSDPGLSLGLHVRWKEDHGQVQHDGHPQTDPRQHVGHPGENRRRGQGPWNGIVDEHGQEQRVIGIHWALQDFRKKCDG